MSGKKALIILGGGLIKDEKGWHTIDLGEGGDDFAPSNDRWRVEAAHLFWKENPEVVLVPSGGKGQLEKTDSPTLGEAIKRELVELGVPDNSIIKEEETYDSLSQLQIIPSFALKHSINEVIIMTNEWHLPRVEAIFNFYEGLKDSFKNLTYSFLSAEDILLKYDLDNWLSRIKEARENPEMMKRYELEKKGTAQIKDGTYKFRKS